MFDNKISFLAKKCSFYKKNIIRGAIAEYQIKIFAVF